MNRGEDVDLHERDFVDNFVVPAKRDRWHFLLSTPRRRRQALKALAHTRDLDERCMTAASGSAEDIARQLRAGGAGATCVVISENTDIDRRTLPLEDALGRIVGHGQGTIVSCVRGKLAYYESEEPKQRFLLQR